MLVLFVLLTLIHWIVIYPVDSVIQPLNNWGLVFSDFSLINDHAVVAIPLVCNIDFTRNKTLNLL